MANTLDHASGGVIVQGEAGVGQADQPALEQRLVDGQHVVRSGAAHVAVARDGRQRRQRVDQVAGVTGCGGPRAYAFEDAGDGLRQPGQHHAIEQLGERGQVGGLLSAGDGPRGSGALDRIAPDARLDQRDDKLNLPLYLPELMERAARAAEVPLWLAPGNAEQQ